MFQWRALKPVAIVAAARSILRAASGATIAAGNAPDAPAAARDSLADEKPTPG